MILKKMFSNFIFFSDLFFFFFFQESQRASEHTLEMLHAAQQERDTQIQSLQEISKVCEDCWFNL